MKILTCIAFHYKEERLATLKQVLFMQQFLAREVHVIVTTNTSAKENLEKILACAPTENKNCHLSTRSFDNLPHPWLLPWAHKVIFAEKIHDESYTHFMYLEDDIEITPGNVAYWNQAIQILRPAGLYPSFLRVEWSESDQDWMSTDILKPIQISNTPTLRRANSNIHYINLSNPYQAMFYYDRPLMVEHVNSVTFDITKFGHIERIDSNPDWPGGGVAERANFAQTFMNVPQGFTSRNVVPYISNLGLIDPNCYVRHLTNKYANQKSSNGFAQLPARQIIAR